MIIGYQDGQPYELELRTHMHCMGSSQSGKSRLVEHICNELFCERKGFMVIDPHGRLSGRILRNFVLLEPFRKDDVVIFDPSSDNPLGFSPFTPDTNHERIHTKAQTLAGLTLQVWGIESPHDRPRFNSWLYALFYTMIETSISLTEALKLLEYDAVLPKGRMYGFWHKIHQMSYRDFRSYVEPLESRFLTLASPRMQKILSSNTLDLPQILSEQKVLLVNLKESQVVDREVTKTLAAFFTGYLWNYILSMDSSQEFYILIDEAQLFATDKMADILDQAAKFKLHLLFFHQRTGHISKNLLDAMSNASARITFTGERQFTLNGMQLDSPHIPDLEDNTALDEAVEEYTRPPQPEDILVTDMDYIKSYRYLTAAQLGRLTGDTSVKYQNTRKRLARLLVASTKHEGKNVYHLPDAPTKHLSHDLLITEFHIAVKPKRWIQTGLKGDINPDSFFTREDAFFLEIENSNPKYDGESSLITKAKQYARYADDRKHLHLCQNFRVIFIVQTQEKAKNLTRAIAESGIPNLGRFWIGYHAQIPTILDSVLICPKGETHTIR